MQNDTISNVKMGGFRRAISHLLAGGALAAYLAVAGGAMLIVEEFSRPAQAQTKAQQTKTEQEGEGQAAGEAEDTGEDVAALDDGTTVLDTIMIFGAGGRNAISGSGYQGTPDWVYDTPTATSVISREAIQSKPGARDPRDLLSGMAGVYVNSSSAHSPAISPNIRGVQDMGRVVISIDGARQNSNRTMMDSGGGGYVGSAGKGFVDTAFIRAVEVERSTGSKVGLAGSLAGAVTFRTVSADDLIRDGRKWGVETNTAFGNNGQHFNGSILTAARLGNSPFSVTGGVSRQNFGEYKIGKHGETRFFGNAFQDEESALMGRDNWSSLLKFEGDFGEAKATIAWTHQQKEFAWAYANSYRNPSNLREETALVDTVTASFDYNPKDNNLVDLRAKFWLNNTQEKTIRHYRATVQSTAIINADYLSFGVSIDNSSRFEGKFGELNLNYGIEAFRDDANTSATSEEIKKWPAVANHYTAFSPTGQRNVASGFVNFEWKPKKWLDIILGVRYDYYRLRGSPTYYGYEPSRPYYVSGRFRNEDDGRIYNITKDEREALMNAEMPAAWEQYKLDNGLTFINKPQENKARNTWLVGGFIGGKVVKGWNSTWLGEWNKKNTCLYTEHDHNMANDPQYAARINAGGRPSGTTFCGEVYEGKFYRYDGGSVPSLSVPEKSPPYTMDIDRSGGAWLPSATVEFKPFEWLRPYVSYSRSYRPPSTAEAFFAGAAGGSVDRPGTTFAPNEFLRPERAETWEVGVNISRNALFNSHDSLRLKISGFERVVEDYIAVGGLYTRASPWRYESYVNTIDNMKMRGVEVEGNYDAGRFWIGGSATWMDIDLARKMPRYWYGRDLNESPLAKDNDRVIMHTSRQIAPRFNGVIDVGVRLLDERLVLGGRVSHVLPTRSSSSRGGYETEAYTKLDLYGSYKVSDHMNLRVNIDNVNDVNHAAPGGRFLEAGRTVFASLQTSW